MSAAQEPKPTHFHHYQLFEEGGGSCCCERGAEGYVVDGDDAVDSVEVHSNEMERVREQHPVVQQHSSHHY